MEKKWKGKSIDDFGNLIYEWELIDEKEWNKIKIEQNYQGNL